MTFKKLPLVECVILAPGNWRQGEIEIQGYLLLYNKLEGSLGHMKSCLKRMSGEKGGGRGRTEEKREDGIGKGKKKRRNNAYYMLHFVMYQNNLEKM